MPLRGPLKKKVLWFLGGCELLKDMVKNSEAAISLFFHPYLRSSQPLLKPFSLLEVPSREIRNSLIGRPIERVLVCSGFYFNLLPKASYKDPQTQNQNAKTFRFGVPLAFPLCIDILPPPQNKEDSWWWVRTGNLPWSRGVVIPVVWRNLKSWNELRAWSHTQ